MKLRVCLLVAAVALGCAPATATAAGLRAGAARADITPPVGTPMFAYTARSAIAGGHVDRPMQIVADPDHRRYAKSFVPSTGVHTRLQARAIVLEKDGAQVRARAGRPRRHPVRDDAGGRQAHQGRPASPPTASSSPPPTRTRAPARSGPPTAAATRRSAATSSTRASSRSPRWASPSRSSRPTSGCRRAKLGVGSTTVTDASRNRNFEPFRRNLDIPKDEQGARAASIDPALTVVRVDDATGKPMAVWSNFAIHETSFGDDNLMFSGDNAAFTERLVEAEIRKSTHHDVVNVWTNGSEGDISPNGGPGQLGGEHVRARQQLLRRRAQRRPQGRRRHPPRVARRRDEDDRQPGDRRAPLVRRLRRHDARRPAGRPDRLARPGRHRRRGRHLLAGRGRRRPRPGQEAPRASSARASSRAPCRSRCGRSAASASPPSRRRSPSRWASASSNSLDRGGYDRVALAGLTNAYISYTATPEEYDACHYEGSFTLFGRHQGLRWMDEVLKLSGPLLGDRPAPAGAIEPPSLGFGLQNSGIPARQTPAAGTIVDQPAAQTTRTGRVTFRWNGGDPGDRPAPRPRVRHRRARGRRRAGGPRSPTTASRTPRSAPAATCGRRPCSSPSATRSGATASWSTASPTRAPASQPYRVVSNAVRGQAP